MDEERVIENLREVKEVFEKHDVVFWLDQGTLLGAIRDGKLIEWDLDVDLGTWYKNVTQITSSFAEFKKRGFNVVLNKKQAVMTIQKLDCNINVVLYREKGNFAWMVWILTGEKKIRNILKRCLNVSNLRMYAKKEGTFARKSKYFSSLLPFILKGLITDIAWLLLHRFGCIVPVVIPKRYFEELSTMQFYGIEFKIPSDFEKHLVYKYGPDWKIPNKKWVYYRDDGAIAPNWDVLHFET
ncbi:MAG: LicD family protein [Candidatus Hermodarchaeota archaeon]